MFYLEIYSIIYKFLDCEGSLTKLKFLQLQVKLSVNIYTDIMIHADYPKRNEIQFQSKS